MADSSRGAEGRITDEGIARLRARIGVPEPHPLPPHYTLPHDRHVSQRRGGVRRRQSAVVRSDYGVKTRWESAIAPPPLVGGDTLVGEDEVTAVAPEHRDLMKGDPLRGVHAFYAASAREWWAPLYPQRRVFRRNALVAALDKPSEFAGRAVHEWTAQVFRDETGTILVGSVPQHDPHGTREGPRRRSTTRWSSRRTPTSRSTRSKRSTAKNGRAGRNRAGGRTSAKVTRSGRW